MEMSEKRERGELRTRWGAITRRKRERSAAAEEAAATATVRRRLAWERTEEEEEEKEGAIGGDGRRSACWFASFVWRGGKGAERKAVTRPFRTLFLSAFGQEVDRSESVTGSPAGLPILFLQQCFC